MLKIFAAPSSIALASVLLLEEVEADYELALLDFSKGQQREPAYQTVNPKGRVPALITEDGVLTETPAILVYIAQRYGPGSMIGANEPFAFAKIQELNSYLASTVHVAHAHRFRGARWTDDPHALEAMTKKVPETMAAAVSLIEEHFLLAHGLPVTLTPYVTLIFSHCALGLKAMGSIRKHFQNYSHTEKKCSPGLQHKPR